MCAVSPPVGLFVGLTTFDLVHYVETFPLADEKIRAIDSWTGAGGPAANAAAAFSALGGRARLLTAIGSGPLSQAAANDLARLGVEVFDLGVGGRLATSSVVIDGKGHRTVVSRNAAGFDEADLIQQLPDLGPPSVVVVDAHYPQVVFEVLSNLCAEVPVVFDPGSPKPHVTDLMAKCDHVIASSALDPTASAQEILSILTTFETRMAAVSTGSGPVFFNAEGKPHTLQVPIVDVCDTLGAGDVLHGAYSFFLSQHDHCEKALQQAIDVAAESCTHKGPRISGQGSSTR